MDKFRIEMQDFLSTFVDPFENFVKLLAVCFSVLLAPSTPLNPNLNDFDFRLNTQIRKKINTYLGMTKERDLNENFKKNVGTRYLFLMNFEQKIQNDSLLNVLNDFIPSPQIG